MFTILITLIAIGIFLMQKRLIQFYLITLAALFPFTTGNFRSIPNLLIIEWAGPIFFLLMINELVSLNGAKRNKKLIDFTGSKVFFLAFFILLSWAAISFVNNEIMTQEFKTEKAGVTRLYFSIVNGVLVFLAIIFFLNKYYSQVNIEKWLKLIVNVSLIVGFLGLVGYLTSIDIPFLGGKFDYQPGTSKRFGAISYRMVGLEIAGVMGLSSSLAIFTLRKKFNYIQMAAFGILLFLSGGRTVWVGIFLAAGVFFVFLYPNKLGYVISLIFLAVIIGVIVLPKKMLEGQFARITSVDVGNVSYKDYARDAAYRLYIENFQKNPILGKGIRPYEGYFYTSKEVKVFATINAYAGGHGAYLSMLSTFGLGGLSYLLLMIIGGVVLSLKTYNRNKVSNPNFAAMAVFTLLVLLVQSMIYITGHSGLDDFALYGVTSLVAAYKILDNKRLSAEKLNSQRPSPGH